MSTDDSEGYLDDIAETRDNEPLSSSGRSWPSLDSSGAGSVRSPYDDGSDDDLSAPPLTRSSSAKPAKPAPDASASPWVVRTKKGLRFTRTMVITALVLAGLGGIGNIAVHHLPRTTNHTYTYSNIQRILVAIDGNGSVSVHGVSGDDVTIRATDKSTILEPVERQIISSGGLLIVTVHCPSSECSSTYDVSVPRSTQVSVTLDRSTDQAEIVAQDLDSPVDLYTGHGDVTLTNLSKSVHVVANGDVSGTGLSGSSIDVLAPIAKSVSLQVAGDPQLVRLTTGQPAGKVALILPPGDYNITCQPQGNCPLPGGTAATGPITENPNSPRLVEVTVNPATTASIGS